MEEGWEEDVIANIAAAESQQKTYSELAVRLADTFGFGDVSFVQSVVDSFGANEELVTDYLWELQANLHEVAAQKEEIARKRAEMM